MKSLTSLTLALSFLLPTSAVLALPVKKVPINKLQGMVVKVWAGYDLSMDFLGSGEVVTNAVIGNPSIVLGGLGGTLCPRISTSGKECNNTGAPAIYLRQTKIDPQSSYLLPSADGKTSLILTTSGPEGTKNYVLTILPARGNPEYAGLEIKSPIEQKPRQTLPLTPPSPNLPIVQAPSQSNAIGQSQWQAQAPNSENSQLNNNNTVSFYPTVNPKVSSAPTQAPLHNTVPPSPVTNSTPKPGSSGEAASSFDNNHLRQHSIIYKPHPISNLTRQQQKVIHTEITTNQKLERATPPSQITNNEASSAARSRAIAKPIVSRTTEERKSSGSIEQANALVRGLVVARQQGQINHGTTTWKKVQSVVRLMRRGDTKQEAATKVKVSVQLIDRLLEWGSGSTVATINSSEN